MIWPIWGTKKNKQKQEENKAENIIKHLWSQHITDATGLDVPKKKHCFISSLLDLHHMNFFNMPAYKAAHVLSLIWAVT